MKRAAALALAASAACHAVPRGHQEVGELLNSLDATESLDVSFVSGTRAFVDRDWRRANDSELLGVEVCARDGPWALVAGAALGELDDVLALAPGAPRTDIELGDVYWGVRWYFAGGSDFPLQPYVGTGTGWIGHHVRAGGAWIDPDEERASRHWFAQAGVELRIASHVVLGVDGRFVAAEALDVAGREVDPSYAALVFRAGLGY